MIIGDNPTIKDLRAGVPFSGESGKELERMLTSAGIDMSQCYLTTLLKSRPAAGSAEALFYNKTDARRRNILELLDHFPDPQIVEAREALHEEIASIQPNIILALGNATLWALTGKGASTSGPAPTGTTKWRGSQLETLFTPSPIKLIATHAPSAVFRKWDWRPFVIRDFQRAAPAASTPGGWEEPTRTAIIRPDFETALSTLDTLKAQVNSSEEPVPLAVDLETRVNNIACCGIAWGRYEAICLPIMCTENAAGYWSTEQEIAIIEATRELLLHPNAHIIGQNFLYDSQYLMNCWLFCPETHWDTMLSHHVAFPSTPKSLDHLSSLYCEYHVYWKDDGKHWDLSMPEDQLWYYNCLDAMATYEIYTAQQTIIDKYNLHEQHQFLHDLIPAVLDMMMRGVRTDKKLKERFSLEVMEMQAKVEEYLFSLIPDTYIGVKKPTKNTAYWFHSTTQLKALLYDEFGFPEIKHKKTKRPTTDDSALKKIEDRHPVMYPLLSNIRFLRSLGVFQDNFLATKLSPDGRLRSTFNPGGTETFRFSSSTDAFGHGCLPPEAEVLTHFGWVRLDQVTPGLEVMAWNPDGSMQFEKAQPHKELCQEKAMLTLRGEQVHQDLTFGHRVPLYNKYLEDFKIQPAASASNFSSIVLPLAGRYEGKDFEIEMPRLFAAILADGSYEGNLIRISFSRPRKIERFLQLCAQYNLEVREQSSKQGYRRFAFEKPASWPEEKRWDAWLLWLRADILEELVDEARHWDAHIRNKSFQFFTADSAQAEWFATACHLTGRSCTIRRSEQSLASYSTTVMWTVNVKPRWYARIGQSHWGYRSYLGEAYCVSVPSEFFLCRMNQRIFITGNTNLQNIPNNERRRTDPILSALPDIRRMFIPDPGYVIMEHDLDRADAQVVAWDAGDEELKQIFREGLDVHTENAKSIWGGSITEHQRYMAKAGVHATNYGVRAKTLASTLGVTVHEADTFIKRWLGAHPAIARWHERIEDQVNRTRRITNAFGFQRIYFERPDNLLQAALAWIPQSTVALVINKGLVNVYRNLPEVETLIQVHDSLVTQIPRNRAAELVPQLEQNLRIPVPYDDPLIIPVSGKWSTVSWADAEKIELG